MDSNYYYTLLAFAVGALSGYQRIKEEFGGVTLKALQSVWGFTYFLLRASLPSAVFCTLYSSGVIDSNVPWQAVFYGTLTDTLIRSKAYIKRRAVLVDGEGEDLLRGPYDIIQGIERVAFGRMDPLYAKARHDIVFALIGSTPRFESLRALININCHSFRPSITKKILVHLSFAEKQFKVVQAKAAGETEEEYKICYNLCLEILRMEGEKSLKELLRQEDPHSN